MVAWLNGAEKGSFFYSMDFHHIFIILRFVTHSVTPEIYKPGLTGILIDLFQS